MNVYYSLPMYYGASYRLFKLAKKMREEPTATEDKLWKILQEEPFKKYNFRRQHPMANYIADFYSHSLKLVLEVDGEIHEKEEQQQYDKFRDEDMQQFGIRVLRFSTLEVLNEIEVVKQKIATIIA